MLQIASDQQARLTLTWRNEDHVARTYSFATTQRFDLCVEQAGRVIWQWSAGRHFPQVPAVLHIAPADSRVFQVEVPPLPTGHYVVRAWIVGTDEAGEIDFNSE